MALSYIALIPAYEPGREMTKVVSDLSQKDFDIVIVDDGSGPDYEEVFTESEQTATVLTHDMNRGKGAAIRTGLDFISKYKICADRRAEDVVVVTVDADGQHLAKDALHIARTAGGRKIFRAVSGVSVYDTQTGLRAFTADMIPALMNIKGDRYEYELNVLLEFAANGTEIEEVPIDTVYLDGNSSSHFSTIRDSFRIYKEIAGFALSGKSGGFRNLLQILLFSASSFASFLIDYALYALLLVAGPGLVFANIAARVVSSAVNFAINRSLVFRSRSGIADSAGQYFALAAIILAGNTFVLRTLVAAGFGGMIAKIITEMVFFMISWTVQRYVIFHRSEEAPEKRSFTLEYKSAKPKRLRDAYRRKTGEA